MRNVLRKAISVALVALYAIAGIGGDSLYYLIESPESVESTPAQPTPAQPTPAQPTPLGQTFAHRHGHGNGAGDHWHFHRAPRPTSSVADASVAQATNPTRDARPRYASDDDHEHGCLLLALVSALELSLTPPPSEVIGSSCVQWAADTPDERLLDAIDVAYLARGPPLPAMA